MRLEKCARRLVPGPDREDPVSDEHPPHEGVGHKHGTASGVEENRVSDPGCQSRRLPHLPTQRHQRVSAHPGEAGPEALQQPACERSEPACLETATGDGDAQGQGRLGWALGQDGAHRGLERAPRRLHPRRTEPPLEGDVEAQQTRLHRIARWTGDPAPGPEHGAV